MYRKIFRAMALALAACLMISAGIPSALASGSLSDIIDLSDTPSWISPGLLCDRAVGRGNDSFLEGDYETAKAYYVFALHKIEKSKTYTAGDVCNNLVLALLYLGDCRTAWDLCRFMLEEDLARTEEDRYGYMLNMLVCAHANGFSAAGELEHAREEGYFTFEGLASAAEDRPQVFTGLLTGLVYNVLYIDMEGIPGDGIESYSGFPRGFFNGADGGREMEALAAGEASADSLDKKTYLSYVGSFLNEANEWFRHAYGAYDHDIEELILYVDALKAGLST